MIVGYDQHIIWDTKTMYIWAVCPISSNESVLENKLIWFDEKLKHENPIQNFSL